MRQHSLNTLGFQPDTSSVDGQTSAWGASPRTWKTPGGIPVVFRPSPTLAGDSTTDPAALRLHLDHARLIKKHEWPKHAKGEGRKARPSVRRRHSTFLQSEGRPRSESQWLDAARSRQDGPTRHTLYGRKIGKMGEILLPSQDAPIGRSKRFWHVELARGPFEKTNTENRRARPGQSS